MNLGYWNTEKGLTKLDYVVSGCVLFKCFFNFENINTITSSEFQCLSSPLVLGHKIGPGRYPGISNKLQEWLKYVHSTG